MIILRQRAFSDNPEQREFNSKAAKALRFKHDLLTGSSAGSEFINNTDSVKKAVDSIRSVGRKINTGEIGGFAPIKTVNDKIQEKTPFLGNIANMRRLPHAQSIVSSRAGKPEYIKITDKKVRGKDSDVLKAYDHGFAPNALTDRTKAAKHVSKGLHL